MNYLGLSGDDLKRVQEREALLSKRVLKNPDEARLQALLWWVIWRGTFDQLRELLAARADPNFMHNDGNPPLGLVLRWRGVGAVDFFRELIRAGADPTQNAGNKSLMTTVCDGNARWAIELLLDAAPHGKLPQADLNRALLAAAAHNASLTQRLLNSGADVNYRQTIGTFGMPLVSALMVAAGHANFEVVELLLASGADVNLKDGEGHTALDIALADRGLCRQVIPLLKKAGGVSAKPFAGDNPFRGFATAARKPAYKQALARIQELTGVKPSALISEEGKIPGGQGFLLDRDLGKMLVAGQRAEFAAHANSVREFVEQHQAEILTLGGYLFHSRDLVSKNGDMVALLPTTDVYRVIEALETNGQNSTEELIAGLRALEKVQPFIITGIGMDFIDGKFTAPIKNPADIVERINVICPDDSLTPEEKTAQIDRLLATNRLFLWWD